MQKIEKEEEICAKAIERVSQSWEELIDDTEIEQVKEKLYTSEVDINQLKNELKKLPTVENIARIDDMNILQQRVAKLRAQLQKRTDSCRRDTRKRGKGCIYYSTCP